MFKNFERGETSFYGKEKAVAGKYIRVSFTETITESAVIEPADPSKVATVTHTGAYGRIKFTYDGDVWSSNRPYMNVFGHISDLRSRDEIIAVTEKWDRALNIKELVFDLSPEEMTALHNDYYLTRKKNNDYWVEILPPVPSGLPLDNVVL